jgi:hypothetical protein
MAVVKLVNIPDAVVAADNGDNTLQLTVGVNPLGDTAVIKITTGSFKFNMFPAAASASGKTYAAGESCMITHKGNINFKATTAGDTFVVEQ